ncbi:MAG: hypothetical protein PHG97_02825 [Candidatus Margulisbacteria bacterium]|nr:hypothetical protein [Candidatus Margulisiibacteriota bacterium]
MRKAFLISIFCCLLSALCWATSPIDRENDPKFEELYRIKIWNQAGGTIEVSSDKGKNWATVGRVVYPTQKTNPEGYTASRWVPDGRVAATAVNAIHIKTTLEASTGSGVVFSLLPRDFLKPPRVYKSYLSPDSSIYTDIPAGESIFGGGFAPYVGNRVMVARTGYQFQSIPPGYIPWLGDKIYILAEKPVAYPKEIDFDNSFGGDVSIKYFSGEEKIVGKVLRPVIGVGRFEGTKYASVGRIRANHAGVIDVSTSRLGEIGGFQIVPSAHGSSMKSARELTQWMVIGPLEGEALLEGQAPFFKYFIKPAYSENDALGDDWRDKLLSRFLVEVKLKGSDKWQPMPAYEFEEYNLTGDVPAWANTALSNVTAIRILFPIK